jgi:hypothetical protein
MAAGSGARRTCDRGGFIMAINRNVPVEQGFTRMAVQRILLAVIVLALPAPGYTQATQPKTPEPAAQPSRPETPSAPIMEQQALDLPFRVQEGNDKASAACDGRHRRVVHIAPGRGLGRLPWLRGLGPPRGVSLWLGFLPWGLRQLSIVE